LLLARFRRYRLRQLERQSGSASEYWERRARRLGARAVFNASHPQPALEKVTEMQRAVLFGHLAGVIDGSERLALDLGCGPGRFSDHLAQVIGGRVIGVDVSRTLLDLAPSAPNVEYRWTEEGFIPLADRSADLVWSVLVLGGITRDDVLARTLIEIERVLAPGGKLFLAENTTRAPDKPFWAFRSVDDYIEMFPNYAMHRHGEYVDVGERISILAGTKPR
jgi:SAM-dependent methyltransferase